ncbi:hypothetical protein PDIG_75780 [Penicillium digitatum PHI26]|uniref:Uncharacterized protein n=2 Tax=Penicillium digitatum TaxID=36651 RepID=K9FCT9_PEND2|nr:hypothetical protein PDIP_46250 [Penicillium digitatum Pd1]EKV07064.1 hypothetical protein PDIG_75780 [Penicillium digitatum PHI26]EKV13941.1 hypothetical protein PDIP_46250 [Penicillium digitatum Pd1]
MLLLVFRPFPKRRFSFLFIFSSNLSLSVTVTLSSCPWGVSLFTCLSRSRQSHRSDESRAVLTMLRYHDSKVSISTLDKGKKNGVSHPT